MSPKWLDRWLRPSAQTPTELGGRGEDLAASELRKRGYEILDRNYRCRLGEIDIVARQAGEIVFVEVKTRSSASHGDPQDAITPRKARTLINLGRAYLAEKRLEDSQWRIDVVAVRLGGQGRPGIEIIRNAVQE